MSLWREQHVETTCTADQFQLVAFSLQAYMLTKFVSGKITFTFRILQTTLKFTRLSANGAVLISSLLLK
jgi:hypothetical protein